jgi:hypothetical protein
MYPDACSGMYNHVWHNSGSSLITCNNRCDNFAGLPGRSGNRAIMVRNLGLDIRWRLIPSRHDSGTGQ